MEVGKIATKKLNTMKKIFILSSLLTICIFTNAAEQSKSSFQKEFESFKTDAQKKHTQFNDSINTVFSVYLSKSWEEFELQKPITMQQKPLPVEETIYVPEKRVSPTKSLLIDTVITLEETKKTTKTKEITDKTDSESIYKEPIRFFFYGTPIELRKFKGFEANFPNITEKTVANYWLQLSQSPYLEFINDIMILKEDMFLNDWAIYQLILKIAESYFPGKATNEKNVFTVFMLGQIGYKAKIGRMNKQLIPLISFQTEIYGKYFISFPDGKYYVLIEQSIFPSSVFSYELNYNNAIAGISLATTRPTRVAFNSKTWNTSFKGKEYKIDYNMNLMDFYSTYPQTELQVYADNPISGVTRKSLEQHLIPELKGKGEKEAVSFLLNFTQTAFKYKMDIEQFGKEKYFFAEELFHYPFSDCEDRVVLFSQLVRRFLGLKVVLLDYPDHVASAVNFSETVDGDFVNLENEKYYVCDPSYIGAPIGISIPRFKKMKARILILN